MRRWFLTIPAFLLLGAVVNVAVAWAIAIWSGPIPTRIENFRQVNRSDIESLWQRHAKPGWPSLSGSTRLSAAGKTITKVDGWILSSPHDYVLTRHELGWPGRALRCVEHLWSSGGPYAQWEVAEGWHLQDGIPWVGRRRIILPFAPVWPGFAVNTIIYAAILSPLICGLFAVPRLVRVRRGLCPNCAYPIGQSSVCTECGIALPRRRRMANLS